MHLFVGVLIVFAIIYFMVVSPGFRAFAILLLIGIAVTIAAVIYNSNKESAERSIQEQQQQTVRRAFDERAAKAISLQNLVLTGTNLKWQYGNEWSLTGLVENRSDTVLTGLTFRVTMRTCPTCIVVGDSIARSGELLVPAGQARSFDARAFFKDLPKETDPRSFAYEVTGIKGIPK